MSAKLVTGECGNFQSLLLVLVQELFELSVVGISQSALRSHIHNNDDFASENHEIEEKKLERTENFENNLILPAQKGGPRASFLPPLVPGGC